jgi:molybdopterin-binding protein
LIVGGIVAPSAIANAAVDKLKLKPGQQAYTAIKASDVLIGID